MAKARDLFELAGNYHKALPRRIREYLNNRGIPDTLIDFYSLGWNGWRITIPIWNRQGEVAFFKLARDPQSDPNEPKMLASQGGYMELYGWNQVLSKPSQIIVCEGEFDRLVLESLGFAAVTSTGGAGTFRSEWAKDFEPIPELYLCFDHDEAGRSGTLKVGQIIRQAKMIELPEEVAEGGDVTDFFVRLKKSKEDFLKLMEEAQPVPPLPKVTPPRYVSRNPDSFLAWRIERIKKALPIDQVIAQYVQLKSSGSTLTGLCPFHADHNPSLTVYPGTGTFHCFGCKTRGDAIKFIMEVERVSFGQALDALDELRLNYDRES